MPQKRKQYVKLADGTLEQQMLATSADIVEIEAITGITATDVQGALEELKDLADNGGVTSVNNKTGAVTISKSDVGLGNVNNTSDANKPVSTAQQTAINTAKSDAISDAKSYTDTQLASYIKTSAKGVAGGVASLGTDGKVPSTQLPSYVDDVVEGTYTANATTPTGETGKIYVDTSSNKTFRWSGSKYVEISSSLALGTTSSTAYRGDLGAANATAIGTLQTKVGTLETADGNNVKLTGDQTIAGIKKFSSAPQLLSGALISAGKALTFEVSNQNTNKVTIEVDDRSSNASLVLPNASGTLALDTAASTSANGLMTSAMVTKLNGIATGATANKGTVTSVTITAGTGISVNSSSAITSSGSRTISLADSGVTAGTYSAVAVDAKGRVTAGNQLVEWGTDGQTTPSASLAVGGLFFMKV